MYKWLTVLLLALVSEAAWSNTLQPFTTDGCSDFPDGTPARKTLWLNCCIAHDKAYWAGGTHAQRQIADAVLEKCVADAGEPVIAHVMHAGVRVGGAPYWPTSFRWGYGWREPRGYEALTDREQAEAARLLKEWDRQSPLHATADQHK